MLIQQYKAVRQQTEDLCKPLASEDYVIQTIEDVSPPKWHLAHTSWFFETFVLSAHCKNYKIFHPMFHYLFNSYYQSIGNPYPRIQRGFLSRPTVKEIYEYRKYINEQLITMIEQTSEDNLFKIKSLIELGLQHEQQHQELLLMDIKYNFSHDPCFPAYQTFNPSSQDSAPSIDFIKVEGGLIEVGHNQNNAFCFDNELPRHQQILKPYSIATRLVTNEEYLEFITAGGYQNPTLWLADGWQILKNNNWQAPLYWRYIENNWHLFTLSGLKKLNPAEPVSHVSYYEADAYARWRGFRLPLEAEWEHFVTTSEMTLKKTHNFLENKILHPQPAIHSQQFFGDLWEWTSSPYCPYPGYKPLRGALGEYNGKFMSNQIVLRGGSCATPQSHIRATYRNFFQPDKRWQFSGIRLAADI